MFILFAGNDGNIFRLLAHVKLGFGDIYAGYSHWLNYLRSANKLIMMITKNKFGFLTDIDLANTKLFVDVRV